MVARFPSIARSIGSSRTFWPGNCTPEHRNGMLSQKSTTMNYLYAPRSVAQRQSLFSEVKEALGEDEHRLELLQDLDVFSEKLSQINNHPELVILLDIGKKNLTDIIALRTLIRDTSVIIMLSDEAPSTVSTAIRMRPRFLGVMNDDLEKIVPVVKKIMRTRRRRAVATAESARLCPAE